MRHPQPEADAIVGLAIERIGRHGEKLEKETDARRAAKKNAADDERRPR
jgi:hypothetical protein